MPNLKKLYFGRKAFDTTHRITLESTVVIALTIRLAQIANNPLRGEGP